MSITTQMILDEERAFRINAYYGRPRIMRTSVPVITNVIFNDPATIVFWSDNTKTVVKCQEGDEFDPEKGLTMAIAKKAYGNKGSYCNVIKKWCEPYWEKMAEEMDFRDCFKQFFQAITLGKKPEYMGELGKFIPVTEHYGYSCLSNPDSPTGDPEYYVCHLGARYVLNKPESRNSERHTPTREEAVNLARQFEAQYYGGVAANKEER